MLAPAFALVAMCSADVLAPSSIPHAAWADTGPICPSTGSDSRQWVPQGAVAIVGIDAVALRASAWFADLEAVAHAHPTLASILAPVERCGVVLSDVRELTIGMSARDDAVAIVRAAGLGRPATIDCVARELTSTIGAAPWTRRTSGCTSVLRLQGGRGQAFVLDDDTVVIATRGWTASVGDRVAGERRPAGASPERDGGLAWARRSVDVSRTLWFAANVPASAARSLGIQGAALQRVGGSIELAAGLDVRVTAEFHTAGDATAAARAIEAQLHRLRLAAPMFAIPIGAIDGIAVAAQGPRVDLTVVISEADLRALRSLLEGPGTPGAPGHAPVGRVRGI